MGNQIKRLQYILTWRKNNPDRVKAAHQKYKKNHPWLIAFYAARKRCAAGGVYFDRGIKLLMTVEDFKFLWFRDKANLMTKPSIDRKEGTKNYTLKNCRFIEYKDNLARPRYKRASGWDVYIKCKICKRNDRPYNGNGLCRHCYQIKYRREFGRKS